MSYELIEWARMGIIIQKGEPKFIETAPMSRRKEIKMKGNSKKLAVFVMIAAITMFSAAAIAWDRTHLIQGDYAVTGFNNCLFAFNGFSESAGTFYIPSGDPLWQNAFGALEAIMTFDGHGNGSYKGWIHSNWVGAKTPPGPEQASLSQVNIKFKYKVGEGGQITFITQDCDYVLCGPVVGGTCQGLPTYFRIPNYYGVISPDGMNINITLGPPILHTILVGCPNRQEAVPLPLQVSCNNMFTGFKVPHTYQLPTYE
jgi:hypothetical protein